MCDSASHALLAYCAQAKSEDDLDNRELQQTVLLDSNKAANSKYELWRLEDRCKKA